LADERADQTRRRAEVAANAPSFAPTLKADQAAAAEQRAVEEAQHAAIERARAEQEAKDAAKALIISRIRTCDANFLDTDDQIFSALRFCMKVDTENPSLGEPWNDDIEVINIMNPHIKIIAYEHDNFQGRKIELYCGLWELIGPPENEISSIKAVYLESIEGIQCNTGTRQSVTYWDQ
jgi:hypothetical protein